MNETDGPLGAPAISITLPSEWERLALDPEQVRTRFNAMAADVGWAPEQIERMVSAISKDVIEAISHGMVYAGGYLAPPDEELEAVGLSASMFILVDTPGDQEGSIPFLAWEAAVELAVQADSVQLVRKPELTLISGEDAVKVVSYESLPASGPLDELMLLGVTYYTSLPDRGTAVVFGFRTPCIWVADEFEMLFDGIVGTAVLPAIDMLRRP